MKLSEIKQILASGQIQLTKSLGQNFLHDANQLRRIIALADLDAGDKILEIGPGLGPLTELLLPRVSEVLAIEKDRRLVEVLRSKTDSTPQAAGLQPEGSKKHPKAVLRLVHADALEYLREHPQDWSKWKVVSNLPYSVASPILVELVQARSGPSRIVVTLQIEVAKRLVAVAGDPDYGVLSLLVQLDYEPKGWFKIPAGCFFPEPEVDSAAVHLERRARALLPIEQRELFARIVKRSFSQRRKMMMKLLKEDFASADVQLAFKSLELGSQIRAERVTLQQFAALTTQLAESKPGSEQDG